MAENTHKINPILAFYKQYHPVYMPLTENNSISQLPLALLTASKSVYLPLDYQIEDYQQESESLEYCAASFVLNGLKVKHRLAKITPTKTGQFVTIWKRNEEGITAPFNASDDLDLLIISALSGDHFGQFIFPKTVLVYHKIITQNQVEGKRGIRIYPPWDTVTSKQAEKTQQWQTQYFLRISMPSAVDLTLAQKLLNP